MQVAPARRTAPAGRHWIFGIIPPEATPEASSACASAGRKVGQQLSPMRSRMPATSVRKTRLVGADRGRYFPGDDIGVEIECTPAAPPGRAEYSSPTGATTGTKPAAHQCREDPGIHSGPQRRRSPSPGRRSLPSIRAPSTPLMPDRPSPAAVDRGDDVLVHQAGQHRDDDLEGGLVGDALTADELARYAQLLAASR